MKKILFLAVALIMSVGAWAEGLGLEYIVEGYKYYVSVNSNSAQNVFFGSTANDATSAYQTYGRYSNPQNVLAGLISFSVKPSENAGFYNITDNRSEELVAYDKTHTNMNNHAKQTVRPLVGDNASNENYVGNTDWKFQKKVQSWGQGFTIGPKQDDAAVNWNDHNSSLGMWGGYDQASVVMFVPADEEALNDLLTKVQAKPGCVNAETLKDGDTYDREASKFFGKQQYTDYNFADAKALVTAYFAEAETYHEPLVIADGLVVTIKNRQHKYYLYPNVDENSVAGTKEEAKIANWTITATDVEGKFSLKSGNYYIKSVPGGHDAAADLTNSADEAEKFTIALNSDGFYTLQLSSTDTKDNSHMYAHGVQWGMVDGSKENNVGAIVRWAAESEASQWTLTKVESYTLEIGATGYSTLFLGENVTIPEGVTVYYCTEEEEGKLTATAFDANDVIPANIGVVVKGTPSTSYVFPYTEDDYEGEAALDESALYGVYEDTSVADVCDYLEYEGDVYVLSVVQEKLGFYKYADTEMLKGNRAFYIPTSAMIGVQGFVIDFGGEQTTGIISVNENANANVNCFDLAGRRVNANVKGISIVNGKKIVK